MSSVEVWLLGLLEFMSLTMQKDKILAEFAGFGFR